MNDDLKMNEQLSALADGQLQGHELDQALSFAAQGRGRETWQVYHLVGDVLRSPELAHSSDSAAFLSRLHQSLAQEPLLARPTLTGTEPEQSNSRQKAANASVFRWKMVAGVASLAAVSVMGWNALSHVRDADNAPRLAAAQPAATQQVMVGNGQDAQVMLRDPRLDELLAAHKQYGGATALQMPAGFLRNATFESPSR